MSLIFGSDGQLRHISQLWPTGTTNTNSPRYPGTKEEWEKWEAIKLATMPPSLSDADVDRIARRVVELLKKEAP